MCEFSLKQAGSLPAFDVPPGFTIESYFEKVSRDGFAERCKVLEPLAAAGRLRAPDRGVRGSGSTRRSASSGAWASPATS